MDNSSKVFFYLVNLDSPNNIYLLNHLNEKIIAVLYLCKTSVSEHAHK